MNKSLKYSQCIRDAINYLLKKDKYFHVIGQGVTSPWYVGGTLTELDKSFPNRVIEATVSENLITGLGAGASMLGVNCLVVHPRMDFMLYAADSIINQISKWSYITGGSINTSVTIRGIINRGGSQGAQHSQSLHSIFAHFPGLRVVMPYSPEDAHNLLIASVKCKDPVLFIDDKWLYETKQIFKPNYKIELKKIKPKVLIKGTDITIIGNSYSSHLAVKASKKLLQKKINAEVIDLRILNPLDISNITKSANKTGRILVIDGGHENFGLANSLIGSIVKKINLKKLKHNPEIISLPNTPAPSSEKLEKIYYPNTQKIVDTILKMFKK